MSRNFEKELPSNYELVYSIDAKSKRIGVIFTIVSLVILLVVMGICVIPLIINNKFNIDLTSPKYLYAYLVFMVVMIVYIILHELVHGIAYKGLTKEKLTFGLSCSCAFCGVPNIYCYRKTALIALVSPLIVFTIILIPITIWMYYVDAIFYLMSAFVLGLHLGGCCGDIFITWLLLTKFKSKTTLIKDTGPAQSIYIEKTSN
jgi:hypothetical protein